VDYFRQTVFPLVLAGGAILALAREMAAFRDSSSPFRLARLLRRGACSVMIIILALLLGMGKTDPAHLAPAQALKTFYYWGAVLLLAFGTVGLAVVDAYCSFRALEHELRTTQNEEIARLRHQIAVSQPALNEEIARLRHQIAVSQPALPPES
jgi:hypothetical protein